MVREGGMSVEASKQEIEIDSPEIIFGIDKDFDEHVGSLREACDVSNPDTIRALLAQNKFIENLVIRKGNNKELLKLLERAVNILVQQEIGKNVGEILDAKELERVIKSGKLPPFAVAELAAAFYHLERDEDCEMLAGLVGSDESVGMDVVSRANANNTLGSLYLRQGDQRRAMEVNKKGLTLLSSQSSKSLNQRWQVGKLSYGVLIDKMKRKVFADMPEQLFALRRQREEIGDIFNIGRVDLDAARAFGALGKIEEAIHYAERGRDLMSEARYWSGARQASELLKQLDLKR